MFAPKKALTLLLVAGLLPIQTFAIDSFEEAVRQAKAAQLTEVHAVGEGVPFYAARTLDPLWDASGKTPIVRWPPLELTDQEGRSKNEKLFDGKLTFVAFFFSSCSGFCPTLLKQLRKVELRVQGRFPGARFVAISVDPEKDTPSRLKAYLKSLGHPSSRWTLLTGDKARIHALARETLGAETFELPKSKGQVAHSEHFYLIDGQRRLRGVLKGTRIDVADSAHELLEALSREAG